MSLVSKLFPTIFVAPLDYLSISEVLTFSSSSTTQTVNVSIVDDQLLEGNEVFLVSLALKNQTDVHYVQLGPTSASITIIDDDGNELIAYCKFT